jgi:hypothetical protein
VQYTSLSINRPTEFPADVIIGEPADFTEPAVGGRFTFNLTDSLALEAAMDFFTKENFFSPSFGATFGGYGMSGQFGVKAGKRFERFGLFGKARPGFVSYSRVYHLEAARDFTFFGQQFTLGEFSIGRKYYFSTDLGGVLEFYPSRRLVTRFDLGDTIIRYRDRASQGFSLSSSIIRQPDETRHNFQFTAGLGFRF